MTDKLEQEIARGQRAAQLLAEPIIVEAFETLKSGVLNEWLKSPARDAEGREKLYLVMKATECVEMHLRNIMESGKLAEHALKNGVARKDGLPPSVF